MTNFILGRIDMGKVKEASKRGTFRPGFQHTYDVKHAPSCNMVETRDADGNVTVRKFDVIKGVFVDD